MRLRKKLDVEPLGEARAARIEEGLFVRLRQAPPVKTGSHAKPIERGIRYKPAVAFVLAGAAAAVLGGVGLRGVFAPPAPAPTPSGIATAPSHVVTHASGSHVDIGESGIDLRPESEAFVIGDDARGVLVVLERGAVECEVAPRAGRPAFLVRAGEVSVKVVGTHFSVSHDRDTVSVDVSRGKVEVTAPDAQALLHEGDHWTWPRTEGAENGAPAPPPSSAPPAPSKAEAIHPASPKDRYNEAVGLEGHRPQEALAIYRELAAGSGPWAMNALFAEGRLAADRGDRGEARRLLSEYLARYPQGPNADDARALLERLH